MFISLCHLLLYSVSVNVTRPTMFEQFNENKSLSVLAVRLWDSKQRSDKLCSVIRYLSRTNPYQMYWLLGRCYKVLCQHQMDIALERIDSATRTSLVLKNKGVNFKILGLHVIDIRKALVDAFKGILRMRSQTVSQSLSRAWIKIFFRSSAIYRMAVSRGKMRIVNYCNVIVRLCTRRWGPNLVRTDVSVLKAHPMGNSFQRIAAWTPSSCFQMHLSWIPWWTLWITSMTPCLALTMKSCSRISCRWRRGLMPGIGDIQTITSRSARFLPFKLNCQNVVSWLLFLRKLAKHLHIIN